MAIVERRAAGVGTQALPVARQSGLAVWWRRYGTTLFFMGPAALLVLLFFFVPVLLTVGIGLTDMSTATGLSKWQWIGLDNFERIVRGRFTTIIVVNTVLYVVATLPFS